MEGPMEEDVEEVDKEMDKERRPPLENWCQNKHRQHCQLC